MLLSSPYVKCKIALGFASTVFARFTPCETLLNLAEKLRSGKMTETLQLRGHNGWVIITNPKYPHMILSSSRDKSLIIWKLTR